MTRDPPLKLLAFSDIHREIRSNAPVWSRRRPTWTWSIGAGDFASVHEGLEETIDALRPIERPTILVPGNNETEGALRAACEGWEAATVLHGEGAEIDGVSFFGLGAGVPTTPWDRAST